MQATQLRRPVEYKKENVKDEEVSDILMKAGAACILDGPMVQSATVSVNLGAVSTVAAAEIGPLEVFLCSVSIFGFLLQYYIIISSLTLHVEFIIIGKYLAALFTFGRPFQNG